MIEPRPNLKKTSANSQSLLLRCSPRGDELGSRAQRYLASPADALELSYLNHFLGAQCGDVLAAQAELPEHFFGVLAEER